MPWVEFIVYFTFARMPGESYRISSLLLRLCDMSFERKWTSLSLLWLLCLRSRAVSMAGASTSIVVVATKVLCRQTRVCREKFVYFCRDENILSRQAYFCRDKHAFVATKRLSRQKLYLWQAPANAYPYVSVRIVMRWPRAVDATLKLKRLTNSANSRNSRAAVAGPLRNCQQGCTTEWRGGRMGWRGGLLQDSDQSDLTSGRISTSACWNHPRPFQSHLWVRTPTTPFCMCSRW